MKSLFFTLLIVLSTQAFSKDVSQPIIKKSVISYKSDSKTRMTMLKLKYSLTNAKQINFKCEVKLPLTPLSYMMLVKKPNNNRFQNTSNTYNPRFNKLDQIDINAIVAKNKLYNITRSGVNIKTF